MTTDNVCMQQREWLKTDFSEYDASQTGRNQGDSQPVEYKQPEKVIRIISLPSPEDVTVCKPHIRQCINDRRSIRHYDNDAMTLEQLSFMLWATQGVTGKRGGLTLRTVPCSGASHSFETYLFVLNVGELEAGVYQYLPQHHSLAFISKSSNISEQVDVLTLNQPFVPHFAKRAGVLFAWSTIPERSEWKFGITAHKKILLDAGHICQNLYLAAESLNLGACAIGIYDQQLIDNLIQVDGINEFVIYLASVGIKRREKAL